MERLYLQKFDKLMHNLFKEEDDVIGVLTPDEIDMKKKVMTAYTLMLSKPTLTDREVRKYLRTTFGISETSALTVLHYTKMALGTVRNASKEWYRYIIAEAFLNNYRIAMEDKDLLNANSALDKLAKYMKLDKEEGESMPWDQIIPPTVLISGDVSDAGPFKRVPNIDEKIIALTKRYAVEAPVYESNELIPTSRAEEDTID